MTVTRTTSSDERIVLDVVGEIDYTTAPGMYDDVLALTGDGRHLVLDFTRVGFCDSSGVSAMLGVWRRLHGEGGTLTVTEAPPHLARAMRLLGMDRLITVRPREARTAAD
ncbi:STAS domain-containing protein [Saccharothrix sp. HUAS TT1]|uniref:STAS domain-containing protein n=1 Tax=unclassified Saccharothrix TaxID=2593673 RepID=UPI00345C057E